MVTVPEGSPPANALERSRAAQPAQRTLDGSGSGQADNGSGLPSGGPKCVHRFVYGGRSELVHPRCEQPGRLLCEDCGAVQIKRCDSTRRSRCVSCSESWRRRLVQIVRSGLAGDRVGSSFFVTLTAPGVAEGMVWSIKPVLREGEVGTLVMDFRAEPLAVAR